MQIQQAIHGPLKWDLFFTRANLWDPMQSKQPALNRRLLLGQRPFNCNLRTLEPVEERTKYQLYKAEINGCVKYTHNPCRTA